MTHSGHVAVETHRETIGLLSRQLPSGPLTPRPPACWLLTYFILFRSGRRPWVLTAFCAQLGLHGCQPWSPSCTIECVVGPVTDTSEPADGLAIAPSSHWRSRLLHSRQCVKRRK